jgi:hypothetical protein
VLPKAKVSRSTVQLYNFSYLFVLDVFNVCHPAEACCSQVESETYRLRRRSPTRIGYPITTSNLCTFLYKYDASTVLKEIES